jgi:penicillin-binding protein 1A
LAVDTAARKTGRGRRHAPRKPRAQKGFKAWLRRWWWVFVVVPASAMLLVLGMLVWVYSQLELPETPPPLQTTYIYDADGNQIATLHAGVDRTIIELREMPKALRNAVIAVEDQDFYGHGGIDPIGILRAAWTDVVAGEVVQGGSTITQQVVKTIYAGEYREDENGQEIYVTPPRSIGQKVREALLAIKVEQSFTKDEILEKYLNTVYFGRGAYGVQAAAQTYYQKDAEDLTIAESAMLAGLIRSPGSYDPVVDPDGAALDRRNFVLDRMVAEGYLDADRGEATKAEDVRTNAIDQFGGVRFRGDIGYFLDHTRRTLIAEYGEAAVFGGGLRVTTSLDMDLQRAAEDAVATNLDTEGDPDAALVAIDPRTGAVVAMVGGRNFNQEHVNLATGAGGTGRQAGSAFKPFTLIAALEQGYALNKYWQGPSSIEIDDPACYTNGEPWEVGNASDSESGTFTLLSATTHSVNTVYAQVVSAVTPAAVVGVAERMGIRSDLSAVCSIALGTQDVTPLDMATAYATLAARGIHRDPSPLLRVADPNGEELFTPDEGERVLRPNDADLATYALATVVTSGTGTNARLPDGRPVAGKTGTNQEYRDAWFCGYTPQLATCVWVGYAEGQISMTNIEGYSAVFGGTIPANIWRDFMEQAMAGRRVIEFHEPVFDGYTLGPPTPVPSPTPSPSPSESPSPEPSESPSPEPSQSPTPSESPSPEPSPTVSPTPGASPTPAPRAGLRRRDESS